jgi:hypothetical protein
MDLSHLLPGCDLINPNAADKTTIAGTLVDIAAATGCEKELGVALADGCKFGSSPRNPTEFAVTAPSRPDLDCADAIRDVICNPTPALKRALAEQLVDIAATAGCEKELGVALGAYLAVAGPTLRRWLDTSPVVESAEVWCI